MTTNTTTTTARPDFADWIIDPTSLGAARARVAIVLGTNGLFMALWTLLPTLTR